MEPYIVCLVANQSKSGKTVLIEKLIQWFKQQGISVATIKHVGGSHSYEALEKDSVRHLNAGAQIVAVVDSTSINLKYCKPDGSGQLHSALSSLMAVTPQPYPQLIFVEGYKQSKYPKIFLMKSLDDIDALPEGEILLTTGVFLDNEENIARVPANLNPLDFTNLEAIASVIKQKGIEFTIQTLPFLDCGECGFSTCKEFAQALWEKHDEPLECSSLGGMLHLEVNGKEIPMKSFVQNIIAKGIHGMVTALKGIENPREIKIHLKQ